MINESFKYYRNLYGYEVGTPQFDKDVSHFTLFVYYLLLLTFLVTGLSKVLEIYLDYKFRFQKKLANERVAFAFTEYDQRLVLILQNMGLSLQCVSIGNFKSETINEISISEKFVFLYSLTKPYNSFKNLYYLKKKDVVSKNKLRVIKLNGLLPIFQKTLINKKLLINFNDHSIYNSASFLFAEKLKIKTIYFQHAPVGYHFPSLYHDLNVLFGLDSLNKYQNKEHKEIYLLFDIRFFNVAKDYGYEFSKGNRVLLCINEGDDSLQVHLLIENLKKDGFFVTLRPHPRQNLPLGFGEGAEISKNQSIWKDLITHEIVLGNETGVLLEAMFAKKYVYKCCFLSNSVDNYNFLSQKLILCEYSTYQNLITDIKNFKLTYDPKKLLYYIGDSSEAESLMKNLNNKLNSLAS